MHYPDLFHGHLEVREEAGSFFPVRFTQKQFAFYENTGVAQFPQRAVQSAGITVECRTDAAEIRFDFLLTTFARDWVTFDVYENGVMMETLRFPNKTMQGTFIYQRRTTGEGEVVIYVPATIDVRFSNFQLGNWQPVKQRRYRYLALGCSITQGMEALSPSITYANILRRHLDAEILNQGIGGFVYDEGSLDPDLPFDPDIITVAYGTNDCANIESLAEIKDNITHYLERLDSIYRGKPIYVITPIWRKEYADDTVFREKADSIRVHILSQCAGYGYTVIDGMAAVPHNPAYFMDGFLHPNDLGFALYGLHVTKHIEKLSD